MHVTPAARPFPVFTPPIARRVWPSSRAAAALVALTALAGCRDGGATSPGIRGAGARAADVAATSPPGALDHAVSDEALAAAVRELAAATGVTPLPPRPPVRQSLVRLGQVLAFDPILSGNRNISCMTCHATNMGTGDDLRLSIGEGGLGEGAERVATRPEQVIPRNAPPLFNLHAMRTLFWDGRVHAAGERLVGTPAALQITPAMQRVFEFGAASALPMFPVQNRAEMRGQPGSNELADLADDDIAGAWDGLMRRLGAIPEYRRLFELAYPGTPFDSMTFAHASNAIGGFLIDQFAADGSPWDRFLAGRSEAMSREQLLGARTFLGLRCVRCHSGPTVSDQEFHNVAVAQFGPGKTADGDDEGRFLEDRSPASRYAFRTTPLRNLAVTGPYGHAGQFRSLRAFVEHYSESDVKLRDYIATGDGGRLEPQHAATLRRNAADILATRDPLLDGVVLPAAVVDRLLAYMDALNDPDARDMRNRVPGRVPSGLPVSRRK